MLILYVDQNFETEINQEIVFLQYLQDQAALFFALKSGFIGILDFDQEKVRPTYINSY